MGLLFWKRVGMSFLRAFVGAFALGITGVFGSLGEAGSDFTAGKSALIALIVAAIAAGLRAAQALFTTIETPPPPA
jgi:hypothetical protein